MTVEKRTRAYASLWIGTLSVEGLDGISGFMTDLVCTKAFTEIEAIRNFSAYYNHARRTNKTKVRVVHLFTFSQLATERMCYDINRMPVIDGKFKLSDDLKAEADRVSKMTCDDIMKELGIYHEASPDADTPARPMAEDKRPARSIGSTIPAAEKPNRPASTQPPAAAPRTRNRGTVAPAAPAAPRRVARPVRRG